MSFSSSYTNNSNATDKSILRIHQFNDPWKEPSNNNQLPEYINQCANSWMSFVHHPHYNKRIHFHQWSENDPEISNHLICSKLYHSIQDPKSKVNIVKWELLYKFGGVFVDSDVHFIFPFSDEMMDDPSFANFVCLKNELDQRNPSMLSASVVKFQAGHPLLKLMIEKMQHYGIPNYPNATESENLQMFTGNQLLYISYREFIERHTSLGGGGIMKLPSYCFSPFDSKSGNMYNGHGRVYGALVEDVVSAGGSGGGGSGNNEEELESGLDWNQVDQVIGRFVNVEPLRIENMEDSWCLMVVYGGKDPSPALVTRWMELISHQHGGLLFGIELVWIDDASSSAQTKEMLDKLFRRFVHWTRNTSVQIYRAPFAVRSKADIDSVMTRVIHMFTERDLVLQFHATNHLKVLEDFMFVAKQIDVHGLFDEDQEDGQET